MLAVSPPRRIRSFVRRARSFSSLQAEYYATLWQQFGVDPVTHPWSDIFSLDTSIGLDVGFGMGESLVEWAKLAQDNECILGVEVHRPGILQAMQVLQMQQISQQHVKIIEGDVLDVLTSWVPDASVHRIQILFPDPWPKRRHRKRRLLRAETLSLFIRKLKSGGTLYFISDWQAYAESVLDICLTKSNLENLTDMNEVRPPSGSDLAITLTEHGVRSYEDLIPELQTRFARKGLAQGHKIYSLCFRKA